MTLHPRTSAPRRLAQVTGLIAVAALGLTACGNGEGEPTGGDGADDGETYTFTLAAGALEGTPHSAIEQHYLDLVEERTDGRIEFERTSFEALCAVDEVINCLRDGRADIGTTVTDYTPHMLPTLSVVSISFLNTDIQATAAALYDMHTDYEPAREQLEQNNLQYVATWPVGTMFLGSAGPVEKIDDLNGLRARAAGPVTQLTLESADINVNAITAPETYESVQRGVIDSVAAALDFGVNYQIIEQLPYWTDPGLGQYTAYGMWWSKEAYESLPEDLREIVGEVTEEMNYGEAIETYNEAMRDVCDGMLESPDVESFTRWDEDATAEWHDLVGDEAEDLWLEIMDDYGYEDAEAYLEEYKSAYAAHESDDNPVDAGISCVDEWQAAN
ncbi:TRAP transporter substrate-binding protein DctP [Nesterenkonia populi]|uniref:TRAP transporter substrate-binding protein DctP n=1 Tax=Nesterenkonia populi TaxID=1591087 RepID=UPI0011BEA086|nr:TRAP transporter substrate-binding protein DctP [Nesterenkonia populi]